MIREMTERDIEISLPILNEAIIEGNSTGRYVCPTKEEWEATLLRECRYCFEEDGEMLGFIVLHPFSARPCYDGAAEISVFIASKARRRGIGKLLLQKVIDESPKFGIHTLTSNIYATNEASCRLHEALGFRKVGYRERILKTISGDWMSTVIYELRAR